MAPFSPAHSPNIELNSVLVIRGGAIGDFILTLPAIKALRDAFSKAQLEILGYQHIAVLADNRFYADRVRSIDSAELARFFAKDTDLPAGLKDYFARFDLIVSYLYDPDLLFETNLRRTGATNIVRGPFKIDPPSPSASPARTFGVASNRSHATRQLGRPIEELGLSISDFAPKLYPSSEDRDRAVKFLEGLARPLIAFHAGSGSEKKNWPLENWIELGNHFLGNFPGSLVIVSGEADQDQTAQLESNWKNPRVRFAQSLPLTDLAAVLGNTVFIGHDSGISHLAAAAGANSIVMFGPTDPAIWAPLNENVRIISAPNGDLRRLDVDLVRLALDQALARS